MKNVYGYIRVSTVKQGMGVSLQEQKEAIVRHAERHDLKIVQWFEEKETAAKQGRPQFTKMMALLEAGTATGVIIHKIDRSARNLKDWAALGDLIDKGVDVHFAHESLDLNARGGRLSADIQAVIASDYIRNLRDEALKGIYGRLKQGIYPFGAPIGYNNNGGGKVKTIDPLQGPLVKEAFNLYASGKYTLESLAKKVSDLGLRNSWGNPVSINALSLILKNPFYIGVLKVRGKSFKGTHEPLISLGLFNKVQDIRLSKANSITELHDFLFRRMIKCSQCGHLLSGEKQKGHIYYRCHTKNCSTKGIREDKLENLLLEIFQHLELSEIEFDVAVSLLTEVRASLSIDRSKLNDSLTIQKANIAAKMGRLMDAYIENSIDKGLFETKKAKILAEQQCIDNNLKNLNETKDSVYKKVHKIFELLKSVKKSYLSGILEEKRRIIKIVTSNLTINGKEPLLSMRLPFTDILNKSLLLPSPLVRDSLRTFTVKDATLATSDVVSDTPPTHVADLAINPDTKAVVFKDLKPIITQDLRDSLKSLLDMVIAVVEKESLKVDGGDLKALDEYLDVPEDDSSTQYSPRPIPENFKRRRA